MSLAEIEARLTGPGGHFEVVEEEVHGVPMAVCKSRLPSLRALVEGSDARSFGNAERLLDLEATLGIDIEARLQELALDSDVVRVLGNLSYVWLHWPLLVAALVLLYLRDPPHYRQFRNALFVSGSIGLVLFSDTVTKVLPIEPFNLNQKASFLAAVEDMSNRFADLDLIFIESGGDNLSATFSPELADLTIYVIDVASGEKIPRKGGPGITKSDLLVINKIDLAEMVGASLDVMGADTKRMRGDKPYVFTQLKSREGLDVIAGDLDAVLGPQRRLEEHLDGEGKPADPTDPVVLQLLEAVIVGRSLAGPDLGKGIEGVRLFYSDHGKPPREHFGFHRAI